MPCCDAAGLVDMLFLLLDMPPPSLFFCSYNACLSLQMMRAGQYQERMMWWRLSMDVCITRVGERLATGLMI